MSDHPLAAVPHPFLFDHIPKTGGTYFRDVLSGLFGADQISPMLDCSPDYHRTHAEDILRHDRYPIVTGHLRLTTRHAFLKLRPRFTLSLAREPGSIIASTYTYWRFNIPPGIPHCDVAKDTSFSEFIRDARVRMIWDNPIIRHLFSIWDPTPVQLDAMAMRLARSMADGYAFFGVTEYMDMSVRRFIRQFLPDLEGDARLEPLQANRNRSLAGVHIEPEDREYLRRINRYDYALYDHIRSAFLETSDMS